MANVPANIKARIERKLLDCIKVAETHYRQTFKYPTVSYNLRGRTAGVAKCNRWEVDFNSVLLMENVDDFIERTVPHEMAHLVDYKLHPENFKSTVTRTRSGRIRRTKRDIHGMTWKCIMMLFGASTDRCHTYDTTNAQVKKKTSAKHVWKCSCGVEMKLGPVRHNRMMSGNARYWMRGCASHTYTYIGIVGRVASKETTVERLLPPMFIGGILPPMPKAVDANAPAPKATGQSKLDQCRAAFDSTKSRANNIQQFIALGCTPAGAATYYAKLKKELGL